MSKLVEIEPGRFRFVRPKTPPARSNLPLPYVISDTMDPVEQVDGRLYTSKSQFRAVGRAHGLTEVGTEKIKPGPKPSQDLPRRTAIKRAIERYKAGERPRRDQT